MCKGANCSELCLLIDLALESVQVRSELLRQEERLMQIVNCVLARKQLFEYACQNLDCRRAAKARNFIVQIMQYSCRIWRGGSLPPPPDIYQEALTRTWEWFSRKLCSYNPERASFITWFNQNLRYKIWDVTREQQTEVDRRYQPYEPGDDPFDLLEMILPEEEVDVSLLIAQLIELVQRDRGGTLRRCYMHQHLHVTCQQLILCIWKTIDTSPSIPWEQLACKFGVDEEKLMQFHTNRCRPCFRQFLRDNGISD